MRVVTATVRGRTASIATLCLTILLGCRPSAPEGSRPSSAWHDSGAGYVDVAAAPGVQRGTQPGPYVASSRGQVYYWVGCDAWRRLSKANLIHFASADDAIAAGYRPSRSRGCAGPGADAIASSTDDRIGTPTPSPIPPARTGECAVARVIDGDTIECAGGVRVRLLLIDAPELRQGRFGTLARRKLEELLPRGSVATLELDVQREDRYGRTLAYVRQGDVFVNRALVRSGVAVVSVYPPNVRYVDELRLAADSARADRSGLWATSAFECLPSDYRRGRC